MLKGLVALTCIAVLGYIGWQVWAALPSDLRAGPTAVAAAEPMSVLATACEEAAQVRAGGDLYIDATEASRPMSVDDYAKEEAARGAPLSSSSIDNLRSTKAHPTLFMADLHYASLSTYSCDFIGLDGTPGLVRADNVRIDGLTNAQWKAWREGKVGEDPLSAPSTP